MARADVPQRHFRFRFERSWHAYYRDAALSEEQAPAVARHSLGTIAPAIPMRLACLPLLSTRTGLPRRPSSLQRLNRARHAGKSLLLDHIEVLSPMAREFFSPSGGSRGSLRRGSRLHHVRGHLMRRGGELYWRVSHLRGHAQYGSVQSRTVTWVVNRPST